MTRHRLLLTQTAAASHLGIDVKRFRRICQAGDGPRVWNPDDTRPLFCISALEEWVHDRDDRTNKQAAS